jgi:hypothetical protein
MRAPEGVQTQMETHPEQNRSAETRRSRETPCLTTQPPHTHTQHDHVIHLARCNNYGETRPRGFKSCSPRPKGFRWFGGNMVLLGDDLLVNSSKTCTANKVANTPVLRLRDTVLRLWNGAFNKILSSQSLYPIPPNTWRVALQHRLRQTETEHPQQLDSLTS